MSEPRWKVELDFYLDQDAYQRREDAKKVLGDYTYWHGCFWCLSMLSNGETCYKQYKSERSLKAHIRKKHTRWNLPGKENPNAIIQDDEIEEIEEISTKFTIKNGIFKFIDE